MDTAKLKEILNGLMSVHTCGNESIIMTHCMQELGSIIMDEDKKNQEQASLSPLLEAKKKEPKLAK